MDRSTGRVCPSCYATLKCVSPGDDLYLETLVRLNDHGVNRLISLYYFEKEGPLQSLLHQLKYNGMSSLGEEFGRRIGEKFGNTIADCILIPVPLHTAKRREREFNQAEMICRGIARSTGVMLRPDILERVRYTGTQTKLSIAEREVNVAGAFSVRTKRRGIVRGSTFVIVDDVITTGSTIASCAEALREAGAAEIVACSVALAEKNAA